MTRAGRSIGSTRGTTRTGTMIGRGSEVIGIATHQNAIRDATGRQRDTRTATVTGGVPGAPSPRGRGQETEMATAGERGGAHGRPNKQSHADDGGDVHALRKLTVVTGRDTKGAADIIIRARTRATARTASQLPGDLALCRRKRIHSRLATAKNRRSPRSNQTSAIQVPSRRRPTRLRKQMGRRSRLSITNHPKRESPLHGINGSSSCSRAATSWTRSSWVAEAVGS